MKNILFLAAAVFFAAGCASHKHHCKDGDKDAKHECKECAESEAKSKAEAATAAATPGAAMETWSLSGNPQLKGEISKMDFDKAYSENKDKLGKSCANAAMEYCGKTNKDMMVSETEVACLWGKSHRVTREKLAKLDKTPCNKMLKAMGSTSKKK